MVIIPYIETIKIEINLDRVFRILLRKGYYRIYN